MLALEGRLPRRPSVSLASSDEGRDTVRTVTCIAIVLFSFCLFTAPAGAQQAGFQIVEIEAFDPARIQSIVDLGVDIWHIDGRKISAYAGPAAREALRAAGIAFEVVVDDVGSYVSAMKAQEARSQISYHTYDTLVPKLYGWEASGVAKVYNIGSSVEGRDILAVRVSDNPALDEYEPAVIFVGLHHANEWISLEVTYYIGQYLVDNYAVDPEVQALVDGGEIWMIPLLNPDGHQYAVDTNRFWRKNRADNGDGTWGVDLNRNYETGWGGPGSSGDGSHPWYRGPAPFSEPETQAFRDFFLDPAYDFKIVMAYHSFGQLVLYPWCYTHDPLPDHYRHAVIAHEMEGLVSEVHGECYPAKKSSDFYVTSGDANDWTYVARGALSFTIELRSDTVIPGFMLPPAQIIPTFEENLPAALRLVALTQRDEDGDDVVEVLDNCMGGFNPDQADNDGDGVGEVCDCDDYDAAVLPMAKELCDGLDNDCDGAPHPNEVDADGDGCFICDGDCDDGDSGVNPGAEEVPGNGVDDDCDGRVDEGCFVGASLINSLFEVK